MVTATSFSGRITDHSIDPTHMNARLWDFDVDGTTLKANHFAWLDSSISRVNASNRSLIWKISVTGAASLTGTWIDHNQHNSALGLARAQAVTKYLQDGLSVPGLDFDPPFSAGTMFASLAHHKVGVENDEDRCAFVVITTDTIPPPIPPKPTSIPLSREWGIKFVSGGSLTAIAGGVESDLYDIADLKNNLHAYFEFRAGVVAGGVSSLIPITITGEGDWRTFSTSDAIHISDFDGPARFSTAGAGPLSINYLTLSPKGGVMTVPATLEISTGVTFGAGASSTIPGTGWMNLKSRRPFSYSGRFPP